MVFTIFRELKTIPDEFGNFIKLTANNWRLNRERTLTVSEINQMLNLQYSGAFAQCPETVPDWLPGIDFKN